MSTTLVNILKGKCPECGQGDVFKSSGNLLTFKLPTMHSQCPNCQHQFEKEPGYFTGAMYVSYGLTIAELITIFVIFNLILGIDTAFMLYIMIAALLLLSIFNYRISRIIWMYII